MLSTMNNAFVSFGNGSFTDKKPLSKTKRIEPNTNNGVSLVQDAYKGFLQNHVFPKNSQNASHKLASTSPKLPNVSSNLSNRVAVNSVSKGIVTPEKRVKHATSQIESPQSLPNSSRLFTASNSSIKLRAIQTTKYKTVNGYLKEAMMIPQPFDPEPKPTKNKGLETKSTLNIYEQRIVKQIPLPKPSQEPKKEKRSLNTLFKDVSDTLGSPSKKKDLFEFFEDESKDLISPIYSPGGLNSSPSPSKYGKQSSDQDFIPAKSSSSPRKLVTSSGSQTQSEVFQGPKVSHSGDKHDKNSKISFKLGLTMNHIKIPTLKLSKSVHSPGRHFNFSFAKKELEALHSANEKTDETKSGANLNRASTAENLRNNHNFIERYRRRLNQEFQHRFSNKAVNEEKGDSLGTNNENNRFYVPVFISEDQAETQKAVNAFKISSRNSFNEVIFEKVFGSKTDKNKKSSLGQQAMDDNLVLGEEEEDVESENSEQSPNSFTESSSSDDDSGSELGKEINEVKVRFSGVKIMPRRVSQYRKAIKRESFMKKLERVEKAMKEKGQQPVERNFRDDDRFIVGLEKKRILNAIRKKLLQALGRMKSLGLTSEDIGTKKIFSTVPFEKEHSEEFINAAKEGNVEKMEELLAINKFLIYDFDLMHQNALHWAIKRGYEHVVEFLLDNGVDVNLKDLIGRTPLYFAIIYNQYNIMKLLLLRRCDPWSSDQVNYGQLVKNNPKFKQLLSRGRQLHIVLSMSAGYLRSSVWEKQSAFVLEGTNTIAAADSQQELN